MIALLHSINMKEELWSVFGAVNLKKILCSTLGVFFSVFLFKPAYSWVNKYLEDV